MPKPLPNPGRLPLLDALRTVAALGVLLFHVPAHFDVPALGPRNYLFVDLFFLLSGFVLTLSFEPRLQAGMSATDFMRARFRRIWPTMALGVLLGAAIFGAQAGSDQILWLAAMGLFLIPYLSSPVAIFPLNAPQWSLVWELAANLMHGLLLRRLGDRALLAVAGAGGIGVVVSIIHAGSGGSGGEGAFWYLAAPRIVWSYTLGVLMARRWKLGKPAPYADWRVALFLPLAALFALRWTPVALGDGLAIIVILPALFWIAASTEPPEARRNLLHRTGELSFPLYALHMPVLMAFKFHSRTTIAGIAAMASAIGLSWFLAWVAPHARVGFGKLAAAMPRAIFAMRTT